MRPPKPVLSLTVGGPKVNGAYREWAEPTCGGLAIGGGAGRDGGGSGGGGGSVGGSGGFIGGLGGLSGGLGIGGGIGGLDDGPTPLRTGYGIRGRRSAFSAEPWAAAAERLPSGGAWWASHLATTVAQRADAARVEEDFWVAVAEAGALPGWELAATSAAAGTASASASSSTAPPSSTAMATMTTTPPPPPPPPATPAAAAPSAAHAFSIGGGDSPVTPSLPSAPATASTARAAAAAGGAPSVAPPILEKRHSSGGWRKLQLAAATSTLFKSEVVRGRLRAALRELPILSSRSASDVERAVGAMRERRYEAGQVVVEQGVAGDELYAVVSGVFEAFMREAGPLPVGRFSTAEGHSGAFGGLCLLHRAEHPTTVRCAQPGTLCTLSRASLRAALLSDAERRHDGECRALRRALSPLEAAGLEVSPNDVLALASWLSTPLTLAPHAAMQGGVYIVARGSVGRSAAPAAESRRPKSPSSPKTPPTHRDRPRQRWPQTQPQPQPQPPPPPPQPPAQPPAQQPKEHRRGTVSWEDLRAHDALPPGAAAAAATGSTAEPIVAFECWCARPNLPSR